MCASVGLGMCEHSLNAFFTKIVNEPQHGSQCSTTKFTFRMCAICEKIQMEMLLLRQGSLCDPLLFDFGQASRRFKQPPLIIQSCKRHQLLNHFIFERFVCKLRRWWEIIPLTLFYRICLKFNILRYSLRATKCEFCQFFRDYKKRNLYTFDLSCEHLPLDECLWLLPMLKNDLSMFSISR